jgi:hypothetical protein
MKLFIFLYNFAVEIKSMGNLIATSLNTTYSKDGNGEFPVREQATIPLHAGTNFPNPRPHEHQRGKFLVHRCSRWGFNPNGVPHPRAQQTMYQIIETKPQKPNHRNMITRENL